MAQPIRQIAVQHDPSVYAIEPTPRADSAPLKLTLLELVSAVSEVSDSENELVACVLHMLRNGRVQLAGSLRDDPFDSFAD